MARTDPIPDTPVWEPVVSGATSGQYYSTIFQGKHSIAGILVLTVFAFVFFS